MTNMPEKWITSLDKNTVHQLVSICPDPVIGVDRSGTINHFNPAAAKLLGYNRQDIIEQLNIIELYGSRDIGRRIKKYIYSSHWGRHGVIVGYEVSLLASDGQLIPIRLSATLLLEAEQEIGSLGFLHDMSESTEMEKRLRHLSITDDLSGLYNRRHLNSTLINEMERCRRYQHPLSVVCIDIDRFKDVNDQLGHQQGDRVIATTASNLTLALRSTDMAFRYGGDEFIALLPETQPSEASRLAKRIGQNVDVDLGVKLSIGVVEFDNQENAETLLSRADQAMYQAKRAGGNRVVTVS